MRFSRAVSISLVCVSIAAGAPSGRDAEVRGEILREIDGMKK